MNEKLNPNDILKQILEEEGKEFIDEEEIEEELEEDLEEDVELDEEIEEEDDEEYFEDEEPEEVYLDTEPEDDVKPTKKDKEKYAFEKLRKENLEYRTRLEELNSIAISYGFKSHEDMTNQLRKEAEIKEATKRGIDPNIYREMQEQKRELEILKKERETERAQSMTNRVLNSLDSFKKENNLSEEDLKEIVSNLDADGFTMEQLARIENPHRLFKRYASSTVAEKKRQLALEEKKKRLPKDKFDSDPDGDNYTMDDLIKASVMRARENKY